MLLSNIARRFCAGLVFCVLALTGNYVLAQGTGALSGTVKDQGGAGVAGATVTAINTASGRESEAVTDSTGRYSFAGLTSGPYRVIVRATGFADSSAGLDYAAGESASQDFELNVGALQADVTVTAAKGIRAASEIPQTVTVVTAADIEERRPIGIAETYERAPSVSQTDANPFRARPQIRGLQSARVLVLVDGERLNNARFAADFVGVSPSLVDPTQIQSVEVVAGSASSLYGSDAIGGTINISTKTPDRFRDGARVTAKLTGDYSSNSDFRRGGVTLGYGVNRFAVTGNYVHFIQPNYHMGGTGISRADVIRFGQFGQSAGLLAVPIAQNVAGSYPVYDLPANAEISNSGARGTSFGTDMMFFINDKQRIRARGQRNDFSDLGVPFSAQPTSTNRVETGISRLNKAAISYEYSDITSWFARFSVRYNYQEYTRSLDEERYAIVASAASSIVTGPPPTFITTFTGNPSLFVRSANAQTFNNNTGPAFDMQANFLPFKSFIYTTGINYSKDKSRDRFFETRYATTGANLGNVISRIANARNTPFSDYKNIGWYNQFEYTAMSRVRLAAGFRIDNWKTEARPTPGFPVGRLTTLSLALLTAIRANPGSLSVAGLNGLDTLVTGAGSLSTNNTVGTYNVSATALLSGFNPYIRYSTSFREPDITSRYLVRDFSTSPTFSLPSLTNSALKPERGRDIEGGIKIDRQRFRGVASYYRNTLKDATGTALGAYCITAVPPTILASGAAFCPTNPTLHFSQVFQTVNFSEVVLKGFEGVAEADIPLGNAGTLTPYFSFSTINARNKNPDATRLNIVRNLYNSNAPIPLEGSVNDVPFYSLPKHQGTFAPRYTSPSGRFWGEYEYRWTSRVKRVDPNEISFAGTTTYAFFASYEGIKKHSVRGGFRLGRENPISVTVGIDNLTDKLYFLRFQPAPAPGRSYTIGTTIDLSKKFFKN